MNEATYYRLDNSYLSQDEKVSVETWYQLPGNVMEYAFWAIAILSIYRPISLTFFIGAVLAINLIAGLLNWYFYNKSFVRFLGLSIFHPYVTGVVGIGVAVFLYFHDALLLAAISAFVGIFSFLFFELHFVLYSLLCRKSGLHPKYYFAKTHLGSQLPF